MSVKINDTLVDNGIYLVVNEKNSPLLMRAKKLGINYVSFCLKLNKEESLCLKNQISSCKLNLPSDDIISMYKNGVSENGIATHFKCARGVIRRIITEKRTYPKNPK